MVELGRARGGEAVELEQDGVEAAEGVTGRGVGAQAAIHHGCHALRVGAVSAWMTVPILAE